MENTQVIKSKTEGRVMNALILNDYVGGLHYATWVEQQKKTIETRMKAFTYRGELVICCGNKSKTKNAGLALCIVNLYDVRDMTDDDVQAACIENAPGRKAHLLKDWAFFSRKFPFTKYYVSGSFQSIFQIRIPDYVIISRGGVLDLITPHKTEL